MAWSFEINTFPTTGGGALWAFKEFMVSQGWDVPRSGSGTGGAFGNDPGALPADVHAPGGTYAGTLDLTNAWFELRQPLAAIPRRSFLFQTPSTAGSIWRVWYSSDGNGFTGAVPSATARGTAADEQGIINTPSGSSQWLPSNYGYRMDVIAGGAAEGYGFFFGTRTSSSGYASVLSLDVIDQADPADADPAVVGMHFQSDTRFALSASNALYAATSRSQSTGCSTGWYRKGLSSANFVVYPTCFIGGLEGFGTLVPVNSDRISQKSDNAYVDFPVWYWRGGSVHTTERGKKGRSTLYRASQPLYGAFRPNAQFTRMGVGALSLPWDGATVPIF